MATHEIPCAASSLLSRLVDAADTVLTEVARTRVSVHYETGDSALPVLAVCTADAVRLPNSIVTAALPDPGRGAPRIGSGAFRAGDTVWRVRRWWQPPRPSGLPVPTSAALAAVPVGPVLPGVPALRTTYGALSPAALIGAGPGLTPAGDDVLAGALVAAHATADGRLPRWRAATRGALDHRATTAVSRGLLQHALDGYAAPPLAAFVTALCQGDDLHRPTADLLAVGHSSGGALIHGVLHTFSTHHLEGAA